MGQGKSSEQRTHAKRVTAGRTASTEQIRADKNSRSHQRNLERKARRRSEAEARQEVYNNLFAAAGKEKPPSGSQRRKHKSTMH